MIERDKIELGLRNLSQARLRTALTVSGIAIGIGALACLVGFAVRMQSQFVDAFVKSGLFDTITVSQFPLFGPDRRAREKSGDQGGSAAPVLDDEAVAKLSKIDRVTEVYPSIRVPVEVRHEKFSEFTTVAGIPMSSGGKGIFASFTHGGFFTDRNEESCLITSRFAQKLAGTNHGRLIGQQLVLGYAKASASPVAPFFPGLNLSRSEARYRIRGITEDETGPMYGFGIASPVMIPLVKAREMGAFDPTDPGTLLQRLAEQKSYRSVVVRVRRPQDTELVEKRIKEMGFSAFSVIDALNNARRTFILMDIFMGLIGSVALSVSSLGIVNTMVMSILERTREIGIMKAIGAGDGEIRGIFLFEAGIMGLVGGIGGIILGWIVSKGVNLGLNLYLKSEGFPPEVMFTFPWWLVVGGIAFLS
jgi:putative ABC transport system permease protein